jgi:predicted DNA-binding transcriptional regulator AlpA
MSASIKLVDHESEQATGRAAAGSVEPLFLKPATQVDPSTNHRHRRRQVANTTNPAPTFKSDCERLLTMKAVTAVTSYSRTSINRLIEQRAFPVPVKLGPQRIGFRESEVHAWIDSRRRRILTTQEPAELPGHR